MAIRLQYDFIDLKMEFEINKQTINDFFMDNVHYNFEGNRFVADKIYQHIMGRQGI